MAYLGGKKKHGFEINVGELLKMVKKKILMDLQCQEQSSVACDRHTRTVNGRKFQIKILFFLKPFCNVYYTSHQAGYLTSRRVIGGLFRTNHTLL